MEPDPSKEAGDARPEKAESAAEFQGTTDQNVESVVLPIVIVSGEQSQVPEIPEAARAADVLTTDSQQPNVESSGQARAPFGPEALGAEVRELVDRMRPRRDLQLPLPSPDEAGSLSEEDDLTFDEAIEHFVSLAEDRMRELNLGQGDSDARAIGTHRGPSEGEASNPLLRRDDNRGAATQLSDSRPADESRAAEEREFVHFAPAPPGGTPQDESAATMPRLQIFVQLVDARAIYDEAMDESLRRMAPEYREIAKSEVKQAFWEYGNERRAADPRLRGPG